MGMELRQQARLTQAPTMTPQLQQAIKLLQLSRLDLIDTINQELLENPLLEDNREEPGEIQLADSRADREEEFLYEKEINKNEDWEDYLGDFSSISRQASIREFESLDDNSAYENRSSGHTSLDGHLEWQLRLSSMSDRQKEIGEYIIGSLDENGYLQASVEEIAQMAGAEPSEVEEVRHIIQCFDPLGIASRSLQECLLTQIEAAGYSRDPILVGLVRDHLEDLEARRYKPLLKKFKISPDDLREYLEIIQGFDPKPGRNFSVQEAAYVSPDVYVIQVKDEFLVVPNDEGIPHLSINSLYRDSIDTARGPDKKYLQERLSSAKWLIDSLSRRQDTLVKVTESIVRHQKEFFEEGPSKLKPLILKDIAEDINLHESTVSRMTTNKYVATPHGIFELKYFFNSALKLDNGSDVGSESVRLLIKRLIAEEDPRNPLSDEALGDLLKEKHQINIARRTIAKYRTGMGIESSSKRKGGLLNQLGTQ